MFTTTVTLDRQEYSDLLYACYASIIHTEKMIGIFEGDYDNEKENYYRDQLNRLKELCDKINSHDFVMS